MQVFVATTKFAIDNLILFFYTDIRYAGRI